MATKKTVDLRLDPRGRVRMEQYRNKVYIANEGYDYVTVTDGTEAGTQRLSRITPPGRTTTEGDYPQTGAVAERLLPDPIIAFDEGVAPTLTVSTTSGDTVSPIAITTTAPHGLVTGQVVTIAGVGGNVAANGTGKEVTVTGATTFTVPGIGDGAYTSGGTVKPEDHRWSSSDDAHAPVASDTTVVFQGVEDPPVSLRWDLQAHQDPSSKGALYLRADFNKVAANLSGTYPSTWTPAAGVPTVPITNISSSGVLILITAVGHGLATGNHVGIGGTPAASNADGVWQVTWVSVDTFTLDGSTWSGTGGTTGTVYKNPPTWSTAYLNTGNWSAVWSAGSFGYASVEQDNEHGGADAYAFINHGLSSFVLELSLTEDAGSNKSYHIFPNHEIGVVLYWKDPQNFVTFYRSLHVLKDDDAWEFQGFRMFTGGVETRLVLSGSEKIAEYSPKVTMRCVPTGTSLEVTCWINDTQRFQKTMQVNWLSTSQTTSGFWGLLGSYVHGKWKANRSNQVDTFSVYPVGPSEASGTVGATLTSPLYSQARTRVSAATNASPIEITTTAPHGLLTNDVVTVTGVLGNLAANVTRALVTYVSDTKFTLKTRAGAAIAGNGAYTSGGVVTPAHSKLAVGSTPDLGVSNDTATLVYRVKSTRAGTYLRARGYNAGGDVLAEALIEVAKAGVWQWTTLDLSSLSGALRDTLVQIVFECLDDSLPATVWLDSLYAPGHLVGDISYRLAYWNRVTGQVSVPSQTINLSTSTLGTGARAQSASASDKSQLATLSDADRVTLGRRVRFRFRPPANRPVCWEWPNPTPFTFTAQLANTTGTADTPSSGIALTNTGTESVQEVFPTAGYAKVVSSAGMEYVRYYYSDVTAGPVSNIYLNGRGLFGTTALTHPAGAQLYAAELENDPTAVLLYRYDQSVNPNNTSGQWQLAAVLSYNPSLELSFTDNQRFADLPVVPQPGDGVPWYLEYLIENPLSPPRAQSLLAWGDRMVYISKDGFEEWSWAPQYPESAWQQTADAGAIFVTRAESAAICYRSTPPDQLDSAGWYDRILDRHTPVLELVAWDSQPVIASRGALYVITGQTAENTTLLPFLHQGIPGMGCVCSAGDAIFAYNGPTVFRYTKGPLAAGPEDVGLALRGYWDGITEAARARMVMFYQPIEDRLHVTDPTTGVDTCFDLYTGQWHQATGRYVAHWQPANLVPGDSAVYYADARSTHSEVRTLTPTNPAIDGTGLALTAHTRAHDYGFPAHQKATLRYLLRCTALALTGMSVVLRYDLNAAQDVTLDNFTVNGSSDPGFSWVHTPDGAKGRLVQARFSGTAVPAVAGADARWYLFGMGFAQGDLVTGEEGTLD